MFRLRSVTQNILLSLGLTIGTTLALSLLLPESAYAQRQSFYAEIVKIDRSTNKITLKAVMGHKTLRVAKPELLDGFKEGDQVIFEIGQDGTEPIVTVLTSAKK